MMEKSALLPISLDMNGLLRKGVNLPHHTPGAVHLHPVTVVEPGGEPLDGDYRRDPHLPRHDGRVGEEAPLFHEEAGGAGEDHDPAWISPLSHEDVALRQLSSSWVPDEPHPAGYGAGAAAQPVPPVPPHGGCGRPRRPERIALVDDAPGFETLPGRLHVGVG